MFIEIIGSLNIQFNLKKKHKALFKMFTVNCKTISELNIFNQIC